MSSHAPLPGFIYGEAQLLAEWQRIERTNKREVGRKDATITLLTAALIVAVLVIALLGGALNYALPLQRLVPVFFHERVDGLMDIAVTPESMPQQTSDAAQRNLIWQYVHYREGYSWTELDYAHHFVELLSSDSVRHAYDTWVSGANPMSYQRIYARRTVVRVDNIGRFKEWTPAVGGQPGHAIIEFERCIYDTEHPPERRLPCPVWQATLEFVQDYSVMMDWTALIKFNPTKFFITAYPGATPVVVGENK